MKRIEKDIASKILLAKSDLKKLLVELHIAGFLIFSGFPHIGIGPKTNILIDAFMLILG